MGTTPAGSSPSYVTLPRERPEFEQDVLFDVEPEPALPALLLPTPMVYDATDGHHRRRPGDDYFSLSDWARLVAGDD